MIAFPHQARISAVPPCGRVVQSSSGWRRETTLDSDQVERRGGFTSRRSYDSSRRFYLRVAALHCSPQLRDSSDGRQGSLDGDKGLYEERR